MLFQVVGASTRMRRIPFGVRGRRDTYPVANVKARRLRIAPPLATGAGRKNMSGHNLESYAIGHWVLGIVHFPWSCREARFSIDFEY